MTDAPLCFRCKVPNCVFYDKNHRGLDAEVECSKYPCVKRNVATECKFFKERSNVGMADGE